MMNQYFDTSIDVDFIYVNSALKNINFALISLDYILNDYLHQNGTIGIYHDEHTYYFYHIQALLTACGNISSIFYNYSHLNNTLNNKLKTERCARLRRNFGVTKAAYYLIFQKEARNTNEHFDERYDEFEGKLGDYNLLDNNTDNEMREAIMNNTHLRTYDKANHIYYTYGRNKKPISYDLLEMHRELNEMKNQIENNPTTDIAWVDQYPFETIKDN